MNDKIEALLNLKIKLQHLLNNCDSKNEDDYIYSCGIKDAISCIDGQINEYMNDIAVEVED